MDETKRALKNAMSVSTDMKELNESNEEQWQASLMAQEGHYLNLSEAHIYKDVMNLLKAKDAYRLFMQGGGLKEIAEEIGIELRTVLRWASVGTWVQRRQSVEDVLIEQEAQDLNRMRVEKRQDALRRQIAISDALLDKLSTAVTSDDTYYKPSELKMLSESVRNTAESQQKALGLGLSGETSGSARQKEDEASKGKPPLVVVVRGGGLPDIRRADGQTTIDV